MRMSMRGWTLASMLRYKNGEKKVDKDAGGKAQEIEEDENPNKQKRLQSKQTKAITK